MSLHNYHYRTLNIDLKKGADFPDSEKARAPTTAAPAPRFRCEANPTLTAVLAILGALGSLVELRE